MWNHGGESVIVLHFDQFLDKSILPLYRSPHPLNRRSASQYSCYVLNWIEAYLVPNANIDVTLQLIDEMASGRPGSRKERRPSFVGTHPGHDTYLIAAYYATSHCPFLTLLTRDNPTFRLSYQLGETDMHSNKPTCLSLAFYYVHTTPQLRKCKR